MVLVFDQLGAARDQMERVKGLVAQVGLRYDDLLAVPVGVGIGVAFDEARFLVLSVLGGGSESQLLLTAGVAHDIVDDRLAGLEFCNGHTCANAGVPCVLHRADDGTDILVQQRYPIEMLVRAPDYFAAMSSRLLPASTCSARAPGRPGPRTLGVDADELRDHATRLVALAPEAFAKAADGLGPDRRRPPRPAGRRRRRALPPGRPHGGLSRPDGMSEATRVSAVSDLDAMNLALLVLRAGIGAVMLAHGLNHIFGGGKIAGTGRWFESLGMRPGVLHAWLASLSEVAGGVALILGLLTPLGASAVVGAMLVAWITNHRGNGFFIFRPGEGWEYVMTLTITGFALAILGPGDWSLDEAIGWRDDLVGTTGLVIVLVAGVGGAAALLAGFWRPNRS